VSRVISFRPSPERDPDGSKFREVFDCHFAYDRVHAVRELLVNGLAMTSLGTGLMAIRPGILHGDAGRLVVALWITCLAGAAAAAVAEWRLHRRRARLVEELSPPSTTRMVP
jgi:hypothetical protein